MSGELNETPRSGRVHIAFFGLRNAGKSTLVNKFCGQEVAIVSDTPGTTTDPVSKAMEILPLGPCLITDTAGLDDEGALGEERVRRTLAVLATTDIAVWVGDGFDKWRGRFAVPVIEWRREDSAEELKKRIAAIKVQEDPGLLDGLVGRGDRITMVCPIDESAPKGRMILPQVQVLRDCLDKGATATVCQPDGLSRCLDGSSLVVTDAQAYGSVRKTMEESGSGAKLISFSELFARQKGDVAEYRRSLELLKTLKPGDKVLVAEGCTHHRQCNDIGTVKIPRALKKMTGCEFEFAFSSGGSFEVGPDVKFVVHCGGCMLTRREVQRRIALAKAAGIPIVNYGMLLSAASRKGGES